MSAINKEVIGINAGLLSKYGCNMGASQRRLDSSNHPRIEGSRRGNVYISLSDQSINLRKLNFVLKKVLLEEGLLSTGDTSKGDRYVSALKDRISRRSPHVLKSRDGSGLGSLSNREVRRGLGFCNKRNLSDYLDGLRSAGIVADGSSQLGRILSPAHPSSKHTMERFPSFLLLLKYRVGPIREFKRRKIPSSVFVDTDELSYRADYNVLFNNKSATSLGLLDTLL